MITLKCDFASNKPNCPEKILENEFKFSRKFSVYFGSIERWTFSRSTFLLANFLMDLDWIFFYYNEFHKFNKFESATSSIFLSHVSDWNFNKSLFSFEFKFGKWNLINFFWYRNRNPRQRNFHPRKTTLWKLIVIHVISHYDRMKFFSLFIIQKWDQRFNLYSMEKEKLIQNRNSTFEN